MDDVQGARVRYVHPDDARDFGIQLLRAHGVPDADAAVVADSLVEADLRGVGTHGMIRLPGYLERIRRGVVDPAPQIRVDRLAPAVLAVDGADGLGAVVGHRAMAAAIDAARETGAAVALARRSSHFGAAAGYARQAMQAGMVSISITNASRAMPPWGGREPLLGTSPIAIGAPDSAGGVVLDMSPAVAARGKIRAALRRGEAIPSGIALDGSGRPTTDPAAALDGVLLPIAGPKGSGLAFMFDVLAGVVTGAAFAGEVGDQYAELDRAQDVGHLFFALDPVLVVGADAYAARMAVLEAAMHAIPTAEGFAEILLPGEVEDRAAARRRVGGIPFPEPEIGLLDAEARRVGVLPLCPSDVEFG